MKQLIENTVKQIIREFGDKEETRGKMAAAAKRAVKKGNAEVYNNAIGSLTRRNSSKKEMGDFQDKFETIEDNMNDLNDQPTNNLATNEGKQYKVNEKQLHQIIKESVMRILNEIGDTHPSGEGNYALALDAADKAARLGRHQQAANLRSHASRYFNDRFGTEEFGMDDNGKVGYEEPDFWADYTPYPELDKESDGITDYATQAERNDAANALKKKYHNNSEIERRASVARAYPRKRMTGGITSYNNFNNYMKNR